MTPISDNANLRRECRPATFISLLQRRSRSDLEFICADEHIMRQTERTAQQEHACSASEDPPDLPTLIIGNWTIEGSYRTSGNAFALPDAVVGTRRAGGRLRRRYTAITVTSRQQSATICQSAPIRGTPASKAMSSVSLVKQRRCRHHHPIQCRDCLPRGKPLFGGSAQ